MRNGTRRGLAKTSLLLLPLLLSCAGKRGEPPSDPSLDFGRLAERDGASRLVGDFDLDRDGDVDPSDVAYLESVAALAHEGAQSAGASVPGEPFHTGDRSVFAKLVGLKASLKATDLDSDGQFLSQLAVEARWAAAQARIAASLDDLATPLHQAGQTLFAPWGTEAVETPTLCATLASLTQQTFRDAGLEPIVVFDLDETLWHANVIDTFFAALIEGEVLSEQANPRLKAFLKTVPGIDGALVDRNSIVENAKLFRRHTIDPSIPQESRISAKDGFFETVAMLKGVSVENGKLAAKQAIENGALDQGATGAAVFASPSCDLRSVVAALQAAHIRVYVLSATLDVCAEAAGEYFEVPADRVLGSPLEVVDGRYTGVAVESTYGYKGSIVRGWLPGPPALVFGDSASSDVPMLLESMGAAIMVNPSESLLEKDATVAGGRFVSVTFPSTLGVGE